MKIINQETSQKWGHVGWFFTPFLTLIQGPVKRCKLGRATGNETWTWQLRSIKCAKTSVCFVKVTCSHSLKRGFIPERSPALSMMLKMMTPVRLSKYLNIPYAVDHYNLTFLCVAELQISAANLRQKQQDPEHPSVSRHVSQYSEFPVLCP